MPFDEGKYLPVDRGTHLCLSNINKALSKFGLAPAEMYEVCLGREIAASIFSTRIASTVLLKSVHAVTKSSVYAYKEHGAQTGFLALIPLRQAALPLFETASFDALGFDLELVARPGDAVAAMYLWGFAALTKDASRSVIAAMAHVQTHVFPTIPFFARVASAKGGAILAAKLGYGPAPSCDPSLRLAAPAISRGAAR